MKTGHNCNFYICTNAIQCNSLCNFIEVCLRRRCRSLLSHSQKRSWDEPVLSHEVFLLQRNNGLAAQRVRHTNQSLLQKSTTVQLNLSSSISIFGKFDSKDICSYDLSSHVILFCKPDNVPNKIVWSLITGGLTHRLQCSFIIVNDIFFAHMVGFKLMLDVLKKRSQKSNFLGKVQETPGLFTGIFQQPPQHSKPLAFGTHTRRRFIDLVKQLLSNLDVWVKFCG